MTDDKLRAALDAAWRELEMDALASDGPIRDSDVKDAIKRNRPRIEAAALAASAPDEGPLPLTTTNAVHALARAALAASAPDVALDVEHQLEQSGLTETAFSPWFRATCVSQPTTCWAGEGGPSEARITEAACAHTLETGHETAVQRESSIHYAALRSKEPTE